MKIKNAGRMVMIQKTILLCKGTVLERQLNKKIMTSSPKRKEEREKVKDIYLGIHFYRDIIRALFVTV